MLWYTGENDISESVLQCEGEKAQFTVHGYPDVCVDDWWDLRADKGDYRILAWSSITWDQQQLNFAGIKFQLMSQTCWDSHSSGIKTQVRIWPHQERRYRERTEEDPAPSISGADMGLLQCHPIRSTLQVGSKSLPFPVAFVGKRVQNCRGGWRLEMVDLAPRVIRSTKDACQCQVWIKIKCKEIRRSLRHTVETTCQIRSLWK